jgi:Coenzyme PQQ synthesis protein D (PqqD)
MNDKYVIRSTAVAAREIGGEMIIMSAADSTLFNLNETASVIWRAADGNTRLSEIVDKHICHEFEVEPEQAYRDALELVEELARLGILRVSDTPQLNAQPVLQNA